MPGTGDGAAGSGNGSHGVVAAAEEAPAPVGPLPAKPGAALCVQKGTRSSQIPSRGLADDAGVGDGPFVTAAPAERAPDPAGTVPIAVGAPPIHPCGAGGAPPSAPGAPVIAVGSPPNAAGAPPGVLGAPPGATDAGDGGAVICRGSCYRKKLRCRWGLPSGCWCFLLLSRQGWLSAGRRRQRRRSPKFPVGRRKGPGGIRR